MKKGFLIFAGLPLFGLMLCQTGNAQTDAFTYQSSLTVGDVPVNAVQEKQTPIEVLEKKIGEQTEIIRQQAEPDAQKQFIRSNNPAAELCKKPN